MTLIVPHTINCIYAGPGRVRGQQRRRLRHRGGGGCKSTCNELYIYYAVAAAALAGERVVTGRGRKFTGGGLCSYYSVGVLAYSIYLCCVTYTCIDACLYIYIIYKYRKEIISDRWCAELRGVGTG